MGFTPKTWEDLLAALAPDPGETVADWHTRIAAYEAANPGVLTPLTAAALIDLETRVTDYARPPSVTSLPGSPADDDEVMYIASVSAPIAVWHLKYRATLSKWLCVGGTPMRHFITADEAKSTTGVSDLATVGPTLTVPLAGDYFGRFGAQILNSVNAAGSGFVLLHKNGALFDTEILAGRVMQHSYPAGAVAKATRGGTEAPLSALAAGDVLKMVYENAVAHSVSYGWRSMSLMPVAVS